jgi:hypothetical protein
MKRRRGPLVRTASEKDREQLQKEAFDFDFDGRVDQTDFYEKGQIVRKERDLNNDGKINTTDINTIFAGRGLKRPGDPRDIDGDGWITVNDARGCVLQCTKPNCAL